MSKHPWGICLGGMDGAGGFWGWGCLDVGGVRLRLRLRLGGLLRLEFLGCLLGI